MVSGNQNSEIVIFVKKNTTIMNRGEKAAIGKFLRGSLLSK